MRTLISSSSLSTFGFYEPEIRREVLAKYGRSDMGGLGRYSGWTEGSI